MSIGNTITKLICTGPEVGASDDTKTKIERERGKDEKDSEEEKRKEHVGTL